MLEIMDEIAVLSTEYLKLKQEINDNRQFFSRERILEEYFFEGDISKHTNTYDVISLFVASFLKEKGIPTRAKEIFNYLILQKKLSISYENFQNNYLVKMAKDNKVNVERASRGYYQYKLKS